MMRHDPIDPGRAPGGGRWPERSLRVRDRMTRPVIAIRQDATAEAAWKLMKTKGVRHLPVLDARERLVGMVTDRDLRQLILDPRLAGASRAAATLAGVPVERVMTVGVISVGPEADLHEAACLMHEKKIGALPVVEDGRVIGMLTEWDLLGALVEMLGEEAIPRSLRWTMALRRAAGQ